MTDAIELRYGLKRTGFALDIDVSVPMQGITGVFGQSGAGKTSLLRCVAGLETPGKGYLAVAGEVWQDTSAGISRQAHEREIGYVFQEPRLFPHLDVRRNLDYGRKRANGSNGSPSFDDVVALLGLDQLLDRNTVSLSGGEAQRVAIGRALLRAPKFVLMDEPLASLDAPRKDEILPFLDRLHNELSVPVIYVSHSIDEITRLCDQLVVLNEGRVLADGLLQDVVAGGDIATLSGPEAGAVLQGVVDQVDAEFGLSRVSTPGGAFWVTPEFAVDSRLRLRIRADDVSLCRTQPENSTILNVLPATIETMQPSGASSLLVRLRLGGDTLLARVTRRSAAELRLAEGEAVFAQVKAVSVRGVPGNP